MMNMGFATICRRTLDGFNVRVEDGCLSHQGGTFTRHAALRTMADVLVLAEAISLFDRAEMPALAAAASQRSRRGPLELWSLIDRACRLSHRAGTRPEDMPRPEITVTLAAPYEPQDIRNRAAGFIVCPRPGKRIRVPMS